MSGGGDSDNSTYLLNQQIAQDKAELEAKRKDMFAQRLEIIKSAGIPDWQGKTANRTTSNLGAQPSQPKSFWGGVADQLRNKKINITHPVI